MSYAVNSQGIHDELIRIDGEVVQGERQLAEKEKLLVALGHQNEKASKVREELEMMRAQQREREHQRQRLLAMLGP